MSTIREWLSKSSPAMKARLAGVIYLISGMAYSYADGNVHGKILVTGDAAATAHNILANGRLLQLSFASNLISTVLYITVTLLLYELLKPVNRSISLLAAFFSMAGSVIGAFGSLFTTAPLILIRVAASIGSYLDRHSARSSTPKKERQASARDARSDCEEIQPNLVISRIGISSSHRSVSTRTRSSRY